MKMVKIDVEKVRRVEGNFSQFLLLFDFAIFLFGLESSMTIRNGENFDSVALLL